MKNYQMNDQPALLDYYAARIASAIAVDMETKARHEPNPETQRRLMATYRQRLAAISFDLAEAMIKERNRRLYPEQG